MSLKFKVPPKVLQEKLRRCVGISGVGIFSVVDMQTISITSSSEFGNETISVKVNAVIKTKGKFAVDISKIISLCGTMSELLDISETEKKVIVRHRESVFRLDKINPDTVKLIKLSGYEKTLKENIKIDMDEFLKVLSRVIIPKSFLPKKDMVKDFHTIALVKIENFKINFISAINSCTCLDNINTKENNYDKLDEHCINIESLERIIRVFSGNILTSDVDSFLIHDDWFGVTTKDISYFCAKSSSKFPDIIKAIERWQEGFTVSINRELFKNTLLRASRVSVHSPVVFETFNDTLTIKTLDSSEKIVLEKYESLEEIRIGFDSELIHSIVDSFSSEIVELKMNPITPLVISNSESDCVFYTAKVTDQSCEDIN